MRPRALRVRDVTNGNHVLSRTAVVQKKTQGRSSPN